MIITLLIMMDVALLEPLKLPIFAQEEQSQLKTHALSAQADYLQIVEKLLVLFNEEMD